MGTDSVAYHGATVLGGVDGHPGLALEYYASRGETPLTWGGAGTEAVRLSGTGPAQPPCQECGRPSSAAS
jgi:hypothetical protein